jgi:tetratricopeptide (TPR) repeat protein
MEASDAVVEHHGYADPEALKRKAARNVRLLLAEYPDGAPDAVTATEIADSCQLCDDADQAARWYRVVLDMPEVERMTPVLAAHAHFGLGNICSRRERFGEAIIHFEQALRLAPWRPDVLYSYAVARELSGDVPAAIALLQKIPQVKPQVSQVGVDFRSATIKSFLRVLRLLIELERYEEAGQTVREALAAVGTRPEIQLAAGKYYLKTGALMDALHAFEKSLYYRREGNVDAFIGLCLIYRRAHREDRLAETLTAIAPLFGESVRYRAACRELVGNEGTAGSRLSDPEFTEQRSLLQREFFGMVYPE